MVHDDFAAIDDLMGEVVSSGAAAVGFPYTFGIPLSGWRQGLDDEIRDWIDDNDGRGRVMVSDLGHFTTVFVSVCGEDLAFQFRMRFC